MYVVGSAFDDNQPSCWITFKRAVQIIIPLVEGSTCSTAQMGDTAGQ